METHVNYTTAPVVVGQEQGIGNQGRWYHNGAAIAALILLLNTIGLAWVAILREMLSPIMALIFSLLFATVLGTSARGKT